MGVSSRSFCSSARFRRRRWYRKYATAQATRPTAQITPTATAAAAPSDSDDDDVVGVSMFMSASASLGERVAVEVLEGVGVPVAEAVPEDDGDGAGDGLGSGDGSASGLGTGSGLAPGAAEDARGLAVLVRDAFLEDEDDCDFAAPKDDVTVGVTVLVWVRVTCNNSQNNR